MNHAAVMRVAVAAPAAPVRPASRAVRRLVAVQPQPHAVAAARRAAGLAHWRQRAEAEAAPELAAASSTPEAEPEPETVFYEGSGSNAELALSVALGFTLICLPLTIASVGRRLWVSYKFTNKRLVITTNSPVLKREVQVQYSKIQEIRSAPRALGLWGDVVFFLKDGSRLPLAGLERHQEIVDYVQGKLTVQ